jgi:hypothetical protein
MATLSLKKPRIVVVEKPSEPIGLRPLANVLGHYVVMRQSQGSKSMRFTTCHWSSKSAKKEAERLQSEIPNCRYLILQVIDFVGA